MTETIPITTGSDNPKGMENVSIQKIDGTPYPSCHGIDSMVDQLTIISDLELRDDDVILVGMPKSGNHWSFEVVNMVLRQSTEFHNDQFLRHLVNYIGPAVKESIEQMQSPRILCLHTTMDKLPKQVVEKKVKVIYLLRNPKDVWSSAFQMYSTLKIENLKYTGTWSEFVQTRLRGEFLYDSWFDNVLIAEKFMKDHPVFVNNFERMKQEPASVIRELCEFLGKPTSLAEQIAKATEFKHMKEALSQNKMTQLSKAFFVQDSKAGIMRKGEIGDWKNFFTMAQSEAVDQLFNEKMAASKLGEIVRPYL